MRIDKTLAVFLLAIAATVNAQTPKITGGEESSEQEFPFVVKIEHPEGRCTGSLVADRWVLTTAHCTYADRGYLNLRDLDRPYEEYTISFGMQSQTINRRAVVHPDYDISPTADLSNDLALIELDHRFEGSAPVKILTGGDRPASLTFEPAWVVGWGYNFPGRYPRNMHKVLTSITICSSRREAANQICIDIETYSRSDSHRRAPAPGDSGAPILVRIDRTYRMVGIVKGNQHFIDVDHYYEWITSTAPAAAAPEPMIQFTLTNVTESPCLLQVIKSNLHGSLAIDGRAVPVAYIRRMVGNTHPVDIQVMGSISSPPASLLGVQCLAPE